MAYIYIRLHCTRAPVASSASSQCPRTLVSTTTKVNAMAETSSNAVAATAPLSQLHPSTALWRVAKLPVTEIRTRLTAFGLPTDGTKRTLAARLHAHLQTLPAPPELPASTGDGSDHGSAAPYDATGESSRHRRHATEEKARHGRRSRRRHGRRRPSREDAETRRARHHPHAHHHVRRRAHNSRSRSLATTASDLSSEGSSCSPRRRRTSTTPSSSPSRSSSSSESSPGRYRRRSRGRKRRAHRTPRDTTRKGKAPRRSRHSSRHSRRRRHREDSSERRTGTLPAIPDRVRGRIRRGEFVELDVLLQANLRARRAPPECTTGPDGRSQRRATISDFTGWSEAWSVYAAVLTAYFPHLAPRLFHYQHFLALKSRAFQPSAWLRYDTDFRLKLAANGSWRFDAV